MKKKWLVKREVIASTLKEALTARGSVYEVQQVNEEVNGGGNEPIGFHKKKKKDESHKSKKR